MNKHEETLFTPGVGLVGHSSLAPNTNDYAPSAYNPGLLMRRVEDGSINVLSNVCRHRNAVLKETRGNSHNIVCDLHGWTYNNRGDLIGTPKQEQPACKNLQLKNFGVREGLVFDDHATGYVVNAFLDSRGHDASLYEYHSSHEEVCNYGWKAFVDTYSENYHVAQFHPGLSGLVDATNVQWTFREGMQCAEFEFLGHGETPAYNELLSLLDPGSYTGVAWFLFYPNVMIEFYPKTMVISVVNPHSDPDKCVVHTEFHYWYGVKDFEPDFPEAMEAAYMETAKEDDELCRRLHFGRKLSGEVKPEGYNELELGQKHFNEWYANGI